MEKEIFSKGQSVLGIDAENVVTETTVYGPWIDTQGFESFVMGAGIIGTKGQVNSVVANEADKSDQSDSSVVDDHYLLYYPTKFPAVAATGASAPIVRVGCISKKRYIQIGFVCKNNGGSVALEILGYGELNDSKFQPVNVDASVLTTAEINAPSEEGDSIVTNPKRTV